jgi:hypothetical protein
MPTNSPRSKPRWPVTRSGSLTCATRCAAGYKAHDLARYTAKVDRWSTTINDIQEGNEPALYKAMLFKNIQLSHTVLSVEYLPIGPVWPVPTDSQCFRQEPSCSTGITAL